MVFDVLWLPSAAKALEKLPKTEQERMKQASREAAKDPYKAGKPLHPSHYWSTRAGDYQAICTISQQQKQITVLFAGHRKKVYDDFSKVF